MPGESDAIHVRTLFISDVHLGTRGCQAQALLDFIRVYDAEIIYLVGDIFDGWRLKASWHWPQAHNDVVQKFLRKVRKGANVTYIPGNHDEFLRDYEGMNFGGIEIQNEVFHETADGKRYLILHGDKFDMVVHHARWIAHLGDWAYDVAIFANTWFNRARRLFGVGYWSLSAWAKYKVKNAVNFIGDYEKTLAAEAGRVGDGSNGIGVGAVGFQLVIAGGEQRRIQCEVGTGRATAKHAAVEFEQFARLRDSYQ